LKPEKMSLILSTISQFVGKSPDELAVTKAARQGPYATLVSTLLSLRCKDEVTQIVTPRLLLVAPTPQKMLGLSDGEIAEIIYPTSFYNLKARAIRKASKQLVEEHGGQVPDTLESLMTLYGVGRKCANLILTLGFGKPGVCVDTHVHRISNRLGFVKTKKPAETEQALRATLDKRWWIDINGVLIAFGRLHCTPVSPKCSSCPVRKQCRRVGVTKSR
jgi:endonuclease-3